MSVETARGVLNGCIPVGAGIGALIAKWITHWFSRRNFILVTNFIAIIAGALIFITNFGVFVTMRLIQGICIGFYTSTISVHINEISPVEISGSVGSFTQIFISLGVSTAYLFYYILSIAV
jgi:MFS family permease